ELAESGRELAVGRASVGLGAGQQASEGDAEREEVAPGIGPLPGQHLRGREGRSPEAGRRPRPEPAVDAEVDERQPRAAAPRGDDEVRGLQVQVEDAAGVEEPEDVQRLVEEGEEVGGPLPAKPGGDVLAGDEVVREEASSSGAPEIAGTQEAGVREAG